MQERKQEKQKKKAVLERDKEIENDKVCYGDVVQLSRKRGQETMWERWMILCR